MSFDKLRSYILENKFKLTYLNNYINVINYTNIGHFDNKKIIIYNQDKTVILNGTNLTISKMLKDELLIEGNIERIEFHD